MSTRDLAETEYDHRKGSYSAALYIWRKGWNSHPERKPYASAFGLSDKEAEEVEKNGYPTDGLPESIRPRQEKP